MIIPVFITQGFIILGTVVLLAVVYGVCMLLNFDMKIYSSHEHMPIYINKLGCVIARIHFLVLAVPIIMFAAFAVVNVEKQYPKEIILRYTKTTLSATFIAIFIGALAQTFFIDNEDKNGGRNGRLRP